MVDTIHYTFLQTHKFKVPEENPNVNYGLWVTVGCQ